MIWLLKIQQIHSIQQVLRLIQVLREYILQTKGGVDSLIGYLDTIPAGSSVIDVTNDYFGNVTAGSLLRPDVDWSAPVTLTGDLPKTSDGQVDIFATDSINGSGVEINQPRRGGDRNLQNVNRAVGATDYAEQLGQTGTSELAVRPLSIDDANWLSQISGLSISIRHSYCCAL